MPEFIDVSLSDDGTNFRKTRKVTNDVQLTEASLTFKEFKFDLSGEKARYIRVFAKNAQHGFLFADEVIVY